MILGKIKSGHCDMFFLGHLRNSDQCYVKTGGYKKAQEIILGFFLEYINSVF
jgi:hypothetical protein